MLTLFVFISAFNAYLMKITSKKGLLHYRAKELRDYLLSFWKQTPDKVHQFSRCVPCRMAILLGLPQTILLGLLYGYSNLLFLSPLVIGVISTHFYRVIQPNHEED